MINPEKELQMDKAAEEDDGVLADPLLQFPFLVDKKSVDYIRENKIMLILRGLSGSGKSTIVRHIVRTYPEAVVCSPDDFFLDSNGVYKFDDGKIRPAHKHCQDKARQTCEKGEVATVVVDTSNVERWEIEYFSMANRHGYRLVLVEPKTPWRLDANVGEFGEVLTMYFGWFLNRNDSKNLVVLGKRWFSLCFESCAEFREDFRQLKIYFNQHQRNSLVANKEMLHCTAKFCGTMGYATKEEVVRSLGRVFDLSIVGFVITKRTFGVRIKLGEEELELWDRDDNEESPDKLIKSGKREMGKMAAGKKVADFSEDAGAESLMSGNHLKEADLSDDDDVRRFRPLSIRGRRAHITLGTYTGVKPVTTGLDALEVARAEEAGLEATSFEIGKKGTVLRRYALGWWVIYPKERQVVQAIFTGHYEPAYKRFDD
ncbi:unnamed protein product [Sphagnum tenellum]